MTKWVVTAKRADFQKIAGQFHISPVLARIIRNRDVINDDEIDRFLNGTIKDMYDPFLLYDMEKAVLLLQDKIRQRANIRIIGDYDIDGVCAAHILLRGLTEAGAQVDVVIPHRMKDGYGLNDRLIEAAAEDGIDTIITCDNGIAAYEQIVLAGKLGMTIMVTDHHEVPYDENEEGLRSERLPPAEVVVNPKRADCTYPYKEICGAMVAYKLIQAFFSKEQENLSEIKLRERESVLQELLCFAAFATVGDVMELRDENRIAVKYGLSHIKKLSNPGMRALIEVNQLKDKVLSAFHIGFVLGPCLNATGRLDTAKRAIELFSCKDYADAVAIAADLKSLNDSRKEMTAAGVEEAIKQVESTGLDKDKVLVIYLSDCHESLAGIIAGRIREKYGKPIFVLTQSEEGLKGSGRSIKAYHMYEEMCGCSQLFRKYGGHKMAAGLSMDEENLEAFRSYVNEHTVLNEEDFIEKVHIDVPMPITYATKDFIRELGRLEPFGSGNAKPLFAQKNITLLNGYLMGKNKNVGKYRALDQTGSAFELIYFGNLDAFHNFLKDKYGEGALASLYKAENRKEKIELSITYYPSINSYAGKESIQIVMQDYC